MKFKIVLSFLVVFLVFSIGAIFAFIHVRNTNDMMSRLIKLHQIETFRQQLLRSILTVQSDLYTVNTDFGSKLDSIVDDVVELDKASQLCSSCHHSPQITKQLNELQILIHNYQESLSFYITASADTAQINQNKQVAASIGTKILGKTEDMSLLANSKLNNVTTEVVQKVKTVTFTLIFTMIIILVLGFAVAVYLARAISRPIEALLGATRKISAGNLGYAVDYDDNTEFGELAQHFNEMSKSLQVSYKKLEDEITERILSEEALSESEERYALATQGANDGLWDWDLRVNAIYLSTRWKSMIGFGESEINEQPEEWLNRVHADDRPELDSRIAAHLSGRNSLFEYEYRIMHHDGSYRWMLARGLAVRDKSGQAYRMAGSQTDITSNKAATEQLLYNAFHDSLTGLPNRALFMDRLQHMIDSLLRRTTPSYALLFLDLDRFKNINDSLGHQIGDQLLVKVGEKLSTCIRPGDTVARLGGDEFAILLEGVGNQNDALDVSERILRELSIPLLIEGHEIYAEVSIGVALGTDNYQRAEQVLRDADISMYEAKRKGGARFEIFDVKLHSNILDRIQLESDLHGALDHDEFSLVYQPIIDLSKHCLIGFEALVRWTHATRGTVYPTEFIPLAEETGIIVKIGDWILREACRELKNIQKHYDSQPPLKMSVNISGKQFAQENLASRIEEILQETGVDPHCLAIEITESMLMENIETAISTMNQLRDMGVHIHIDDFGTGYSSLSYLHSLPIDALKIDRSFVSKLNASGGNQEIIQSIISLAKSLDFAVIAEGLELDHQLQQIKDLECHFGQGYLFSKPLKADVINDWIRSEALNVSKST